MAPVTRSPLLPAIALCLAVAASGAMAAKK